MAAFVTAIFGSNATTAANAPVVDTPQMETKETTNTPAHAPVQDAPVPAPTPAPIETETKETTGTPIQTETKETTNTPVQTETKETTPARAFVVRAYMAPDGTIKTDEHTFTNLDDLNTYMSKFANGQDRTPTQTDADTTPTQTAPAADTTPTQTAPAADTTPTQPTVSAAAESLAAARRELDWVDVLDKVMESFARNPVAQTNQTKSDTKKSTWTEVLDSMISLLARKPDVLRPKPSPALFPATLVYDPMVKELQAILDGLTQGTPVPTRDDNLNQDTPVPQPLGSVHPHGHLPCGCDNHYDITDGTDSTDSEYNDMPTLVSDSVLKGLRDVLNVNRNNQPRKTLTSVVGLAKFNHVVPLFLKNWWIANPDVPAGMESVFFAKQSSKFRTVGQIRDSLKNMIDWEMVDLVAASTTYNTHVASVTFPKGCVVETTDSIYRMYGPAVLEYIRRTLDGYFHRNYAAQRHFVFRPDGFDLYM